MPTAWPTVADLMTARPVTLPFEAPLSQALGLMRSHGIHEIPVVRKSRLLGMITLESLARRASRTSTGKVGHLLILPQFLLPSTPITDAAEQLLAGGLRAAPVVGKRGELLGVVSRTDLVRVLPTLAGVPEDRVERVGRPASVLVHEHDTVRQLLAQVRQLEEHPLPVVDRKGRLVGAVGIADLGSVLWRPTAGGKRDADNPGSALDVRVGSIMHAPAVTVLAGTTTADAARRMTRERVSSVFVVEDGRPTRIVGQSDLLGLLVASAPALPGAARVEDVYVEVTGLRGSADAGLLADIDHLIARGLKRVGRHARPTFLSLHVVPHSTHATADITVEARLHTDAGVYHASQTGWHLMAGISSLLEELVAQVQRDRELRRPRGRRGRGLVTEDSDATDPDLERKIRRATASSEEEDE